VILEGKVKVVAIIAEYNPLHNGHYKQIRKAKREVGADILAVVMSGSFTERGDVCVADKYTRAKWAIEAGADVVIELPTVYTLSNAQFFAEGALKTLSMFGEFTLCFGTETEELNDLSMVAEFMASESNDMSRMLKNFLSEGYSVAKSRTLALNLIRPDIANMLQMPNNILAVEYIKAGAKYGDKVDYHNIPRIPDNDRTIASSTKIRNKLYGGEGFEKLVPEFVKPEDMTTDPKIYGTISTYALKSKTPEELAEITNIHEGMENRISKSDFNTFEEFLGLTTKRYTRSTIKRIAACTTVGVTKGLVQLAKDEKPYTTILAIRDSKRKKILPLLSSSDGYFYYKPSDCPKDSPVRPLVDLDEKAAKVLKLCAKQNQ
jgi:predicted nucleotidyltransferase